MNIRRGLIQAVFGRFAIGLAPRWLSWEESQANCLQQSVLLDYDLIVPGDAYRVSWSSEGNRYRIPIVFNWHK